MQGNLPIILIAVVILPTATFLLESQELGSWSDWSSWTNCDVTCGVGGTLRLRTCSHAPITCSGSPLDIKYCNSTACPDAALDGGWSNWSPWTSCDLTCGTGIHYRLRTCSNPFPKSGGKDCVGQITDLKKCNLQACVGQVVHV